MQQRDVIIIGAGITGLSAAWQLQQDGASVVVLEKASRAGGSITTTHKEGYQIEGGPNSTLENNPYIQPLVSSLGLDSQLLEANPIARNRFIAKDGNLMALPLSPLQFLTSRIFSWRGKLRLLREPWIGRNRQNEETIAQFVQRRLGKEFLDWAIDPFVSGVYAGDPHKLSVQAATSKIYALERDHGSLIRGMIAKMKAGKKQIDTGPRGRMISFRGGMSQLTDAIANRLADKLLLNQVITDIRNEDGMWQVRSNSGEFHAPQLLLAVPAHALPELLGRVCPALDDSAGRIRYPMVASVALGFRRDQVQHALDGFGLLIPSRENITTLGCLFSSSLFPERAPQDHVLLTAFIGGAGRGKKLAGHSDEQLVAQVKADLKPLLGIEGEPQMIHITRWAQAIPQYELGHLQKLERLQQACNLPGLHLQSNWQSGISVADCIKNGVETARRIQQHS